MFDIIGYRFIEWVKRNATNIKVFLTLSLFFLTLFIAVTRSHAVEPLFLPSGNTVNVQYNFTSDDLNGEGDYLSGYFQYKEQLTGDWVDTTCLDFTVSQAKQRETYVLPDTLANYDVRFVGFENTRFCSGTPNVVKETSVHIPSPTIPVTGLMFDLMDAAGSSNGVISSILPIAIAVLISIAVMFFVIRLFRALISPPSYY